MKQNIGNLIIEVTRDCNLECEHCLRGDKQKMDMCEEYVTSMFSQLERINVLTLTGGEPALRIYKIKMILEKAKEYNVEIGNFYMATNGTVQSMEFIKTLIDLYEYCDDNEITNVVISNDCMHQDEEAIYENKLKVLRFVNDKYKEFIYDPFKINIINEGYGANWNGKDFKYIKLDMYDNKDDFLNDANFYLNCKGNVLLNCDFSYESQDDPELIFCKVNDFSEKINEVEYEDT